MQQADDLIVDGRYDEAAQILANLVACDEEQLEAAEALFIIIRDRRLEYLRVGTEVVAELNKLLSDEISDDDIIPTALAAFALIRQMQLILPFPNPTQAVQEDELRDRVLLTIDQQRFNEIMDTAAADLNRGRSSSPFDAQPLIDAVTKYIAGLGIDGYDFADQLGDTGATGESRTDAQIASEEEIRAQLTATDGIGLQQPSFVAADYPLTGDAFASARDTIRNDVIEDAGSFAAVAVQVTTAANLLIESFEQGNFSGASALIDDYLDDLQVITELYQQVVQSAAIIANQEELNNQRAVQDEEYRLNYHIQFVSQLIGGRPDASSQEGVLAAVEAVWDNAANDPGNAARRFGQLQFDAAVAAIDGFDWSAQTAPQDDTAVRTHAQRVADLMAQAIESYRTALLFTEISRGQDLQVAGIDPIDRSGGFADLVNVISQVRLLAAEAGPDALRDAALRLAAADQLSRATQLAADAFDVGRPLASSTNLALLNRQRSSVQELRGQLVGDRENWLSFVDASGLSADALASAAQVVPYTDTLIAVVEEYELAIAVRSAEIEVSAVERRLNQLQAVVDDAADDLNRIDPVTRAPRPFTAEARDALRPLVGSVSGTRVTSTANGSLQQLANEAGAIEDRLRAEVDYIGTDGSILGLASRAETVLSAVSRTPSGTLATARSLLERSLEQIAEAESLSDEAFDLVAEAEQRVEIAIAAAESGDVRTAAEEITNVENLISAGPRSASRLIAESLAQWFRPAIESRWVEEQDAIVELQKEIRNQIVLAQVAALLDEAEALLNPPAGQEPQARRALTLLDEAEELWNTIFPGVANLPIAQLRTQAELQLLNTSRELDRADPRFVTLSQLLNNARAAFREADYERADELLGLFLQEQPNNEQARLLEIRIAIEQTVGATSAIVANFVDAALDDTTPTIQEDEETVRSRILNRSLNLDQSGFSAAALVELRSRLDAIGVIITEDGGTSISALVANDVDSLVAAINLKLNPPPPPGINIALVIRDAEALQPYDIRSTEQLTAMLERLQGAQIDPNISAAQEERVAELIREIADARENPQMPLEMRVVLDRVRGLIQQRQFDEALNEMDRYAAIDGRTVLYTEWTDTYDDLIARQRRR